MGTVREQGREDEGIAHIQSRPPAIGPLDESEQQGKHDITSIGDRATRERPRGRPARRRERRLSRMRL